MVTSFPRCRRGSDPVGQASAAVPEGVAVGNCRAAHEDPERSITVGKLQDFLQPPVTKNLRGLVVLTCFFFGLAVLPIMDRILNLNGFLLYEGQLMSKYD